MFTIDDVEMTANSLNKSNPEKTFTKVVMNTASKESFEASFVVNGETQVVTKLNTTALGELVVVIDEDEPNFRIEE